MESVTFVIDALKWALKTVADNLVLYIKLCALSTVIAIVNCLIVFAIIAKLLPEPGQSYNFIPLQVGSGLWLYIVSFYIMLCYTNIAVCLYEGQSVTSIKQFFVGWRLFTKCFMASVLLSIVFLFGIICFVIGGVVVAVLFYYVRCCIMADDAGIIAAFKCSLQLTKKQPLHALLLLICSLLLQAVWFLLPIAALMNVYAYKQCKKSIAYDV